MRLQYQKSEFSAVDFKRRPFLSLLSSCQLYLSDLQKNIEAFQYRVTDSDYLVLLSKILDYKWYYYYFVLYETTEM